MKDVKRAVSVSFWTDKKVTENFSPEDKFFMLYLLTNPQTTQLGIYEFSVSDASHRTGYSKETINILLNRFENVYGIIKYSQITGEVAIKNFLRHSIVKGGKPVMDCLLKEEKKVKDKSLLQYVFDNLENYKESLNLTVLEFMELFDKEESEQQVAEVSLPSQTEILEKNFKIIYDSYPKKVGKTNAFKRYKLWVTTGKVVSGKRVKLTNRQIWIAIQKYKQKMENEETELQYYKNFDTFMGDQILDYVG